MYVRGQEYFTDLMSFCDRKTEERERRVSSNLSRAAQEQMCGEKQQVDLS